VDVLAAHFTPEDWKVIRTHELRATALELLRTATWEAVDRLLNHYRPGPGRDARTRTGTDQGSGAESARRAQTREAV